MKRVVSVSLGSSRRNKAVKAVILGEEFSIERIGTDGDMSKAVQLVRDLDGKVDAFGMGGCDLYVRFGKRKYLLRGVLPIAQAARKTPMVDGGGLKDTLERRVVAYLGRNLSVPLRGKTALIVSAMDRFGMAESLAAEGCDLILGDFMFALGLNIPLRSLRSLDWAARLVGPIACRLPFTMLYPTGKEQDREPQPRFQWAYQAADIIAGDYHYIRKHMPARLDGKLVLTNTVTEADVEDLRRRGVGVLVTTTPEMDGRSFGTNVLEGVLVALSGKRPEQLTTQDYNDLLDKIGFIPRIEYLNDSGWKVRHA